MIADLFPTRIRGFAMGIWNVGSVLGAGAGFTLAGWLTYLYGWRTMMVIFGFAGLLMALIMLFTVREPERRDSEGKELFRHEGFYGKEDILGKWKELGFTFEGEEA